MQILLLSRYTWAGNSSRHRSLTYLPYLEDHGIQVTTAPLLDDAYIEALYSGRRRRLLPLVRAYVTRLISLLRSRRFDLLWIERELFPMLPALSESVLDAAGINYVVDYDDAVFHNYDMHPSRIVRVVLGKKIDRVMRHAALVIVGNSYLGDRARNAGARRVEELPTAVDLDRIPVQPETSDSRFTIGWIGSPLNAHYLTGIQTALEQLTSDDRSRVLLVGASDFDLPGVRVEKIEWDEAGEAEDIGRFDVGVMPLPNQAFERGKCGFKLLQYFAAGRPVIASPVGANQDIVNHGQNGFLANTSREWIESLTALRDDVSLRSRMGMAGRRLVEERYSADVVAPRLRALLNSAA